MNSNTLWVANGKTGIRGAGAAGSLMNRQAVFQPLRALDVRALEPISENTAFFIDFSSFQQKVGNGWRVIGVGKQLGAVQQLLF